MAKIVAFLESPSEAIMSDEMDPRYFEHYKNDPQFHRNLLKRSMTGQRLFQAFGAMFDQIHWDNVDPMRTGKADITHCDKVIKSNDDCVVILTFGKIAEEAISSCAGSIRLKVMSCHHPNARHKTLNDLCQFCVEVDQYMQRVKILGEEEESGPEED